VTKMQNCWAETGVEHEKGIDKVQDAVLRSRRIYLDVMTFVITPRC
jgi:hypothetical protein